MTGVSVNLCYCQINLFFCQLGSLIYDINIVALMSKIKSDSCSTPFLFSQPEISWVCSSEWPSYIKVWNENTQKTVAKQWFLLSRVSVPAFPWPQQSGAGEWQRKSALGEALDTVHWLPKCFLIFYRSRDLGEIQKEA